MNIEQIAQKIVAQVLGADASVSGEERTQRVIDILKNEVNEIPER